MRRIIRSIALLLALVMVLSACSFSKEKETKAPEIKKGLDVAYEKLHNSEIEAGSTTFKYDSDNDILTLNLDEYQVDLDKVFFLLNMSISHTDVGTLIFKSAGIRGNTTFQGKYSKYIGSLRCNSVKCLDISGVMTYLSDESWTEIVPKTEIIFDPDMNEIKDYSEDAKKLFAEKKQLWIDGISHVSYDFEDALNLFPDLEEIRISAGLTSEDRETAKSRSFQFSYRYMEYDPLKKFKNLKRYLVYPELDSWKADSSYYTNILHMQYIHLKIKTNKPGKLWDGNDDSLVSVEKMDTLKESHNATDVVEALEDYLEDQAEHCYKKGKKYRKSSKKPKLNGKCLVYMAYPHDSEFGKTKFFDYGSLVLVKEFLKTKVKMPRNPYDYKTFIYVYPKFTHVGKYSNGAKAYSTRTQVRVYDIENKICYNDVQIDEIQPAQKIYRSASSTIKHEYSNMNRKHIKKYIAGLKKK